MTKILGRIVPIHKASLRDITSIKKLILHGKHDKLLPVAAAEELISLLPEAKLVLYEGGHNLPLDQQEFLVENIVTI